MQAVRSLRVHMLALILLPIAALLALGAVVAYFPSLGPAFIAYDESLIDVGIALGAYIRRDGQVYRFELPPVVDQLVRTDKYDKVYYQVRDPLGHVLGGDAGLPGPPAGKDPRIPAYDGIYRGENVRVVRVEVPCATRVCAVNVAETTHKRSRLVREVVLSSLVPELLIALATLAAVWFGVKHGLAPLTRLSEEIRARAPSDLRPLDPQQAPDEARPLVSALNGLLARSEEANRNQQRFLANVAHQLRTPLAAVRAYSDIVLARALPAETRADLEHVRDASERSARLATQLLALARAEPGGGRVEQLVPLDVKALAEDNADGWVHDAMSRDIDLGFELEPARATGDAVLLREAMANLVHNAIEYAGPGAHVTLRTGTRGGPGATGRAYFEVEDDGPGIAPEERARVQERFYRVPGTTGTGSGLGLAIVREIATFHGAEVEIADGQGGAQGRRGCRVTFVFPAAHAAGGTGQA